MASSAAPEYMFIFELRAPALRGKLKVPHEMEVPLYHRAGPRFLAPAIPTTRVRRTGRLTGRAHAGRASGRRGFNGWHIMSHFRSRGARMNPSPSDKIFAALETFRIELPSWGFANTGTRFGEFIQPAVAATTEEKFSDAGQVHLFTGVCESPRDPSNPILSRIRSTSTDRSEILMTRSGGAPCCTRKTAWKSQSAYPAGIFRFGLQDRGHDSNSDDGSATLR